MGRMVVTPYLYALSFSSKVVEINQFVKNSPPFVSPKKWYRLSLKHSLSHCGRVNTRWVNTRANTLWYGFLIKIYRFVRCPPDCVLPRRTLPSSLLRKSSPNGAIPCISCRIAGSTDFSDFLGFPEPLRVYRNNSRSFSDFQGIS
ncbi:unnamed protein product, partial [Nesidiocoris tenuis]